jgi:hypothetical protein
VVHAPRLVAVEAAVEHGRTLDVVTISTILIVFLDYSKYWLWLFHVFSPFKSGSPCRSGRGRWRGPIRESGHELFQDPFPGGAGDQGGAEPTIGPASTHDGLLGPIRRVRIGRELRVSREVHVHAVSAERATRLARSIESGHAQLHGGAAGGGGRRKI